MINAFTFFGKDKFPFWFKLANAGKDFIQVLIGYHCLLWWGNDNKANRSGVQWAFFMSMVLVVVQGTMVMLWLEMSTTDELKRAVDWPATRNDADFADLKFYIELSAILGVIFTVLVANYFWGVSRSYAKLANDEDTMRSQREERDSLIIEQQRQRDGATMA